MSYITIPRLAFSGQFQADVSTVNNDVRHFDNASFEPRFQLPQKDGVLNGWYNPNGTNAMRFSDLTINQALSEYGADPLNDLATGLHINAQHKRSSAKIVDLDPQMQVVSTIFGLRLVLTDGTKEYLSGNFQPAAFRDMANGTAANGSGSAEFTTVLTELEWSDHILGSPTLVALKSAADTNDNKLSVNLMTYGYGANQRGFVTGSIGVYKAGDPDFFVAGRRLSNDAAAKKAGVAIGDLTADIADGVLSIDFSNSIKLNGDFTVAPMGNIYAAILRKTDSVTGIGTPSAAVEVGVKQEQTLLLSDIKRLNQIDYSSKGWLDRTAGISDSELDSEALELIIDHPVAIVKEESDGKYSVILRENHGGLYARADKFVYRMDPPLGDINDSDNDTNYVHDTLKIRVSQWGKPLAGVPIVTALQGTNVTNSYWGAAGSNEQDPPTADFHAINTPSSAINFSTGFVSNHDGWAISPIKVWNPYNPRDYVDGQIYTIEYSMGIANASPQAMLDLAVVHAREAHEYPNPPDWDTHIAPFMQQYDNLYPIMSKHLFSLSDSAIFKKNATLLTLAFKLPFDDPNHMPVTRDLSSSKRQAVLNWLSMHTGEAAPTIVQPVMDDASEIIHAATAEMPKPKRRSDDNLAAMVGDIPDDTGGKNPVMKSYLATEISRTEKEN